MVDGVAGRTLRVPARLRGFSAQLAGTVAVAGSQWVAMLLLARQAGPAAVGTVGLGQAIVGTVFAGLTLHLKEYRATDPEGRFPLRAYLRVRLWAGALAVACCVVGVLWVAPARDVLLVTGALALARALEATSDLYHGELLRTGQTERVGWRLAARALLALPLVAGAVLWSGTATAFATGVLAAMTLFVGGLEWPRLRAALTPAGDVRDAAWAIARQGVWPAAILVLVSAYTTIPRVMLEERTGAAELGILVAATQLAVPATLVGGAIGQTNAAPIAQALTAGDGTRLRRLVGRAHVQALAVAITGTLVIWVFAPALLPLVYGSAFASGATALRLLVLANGLAVVSAQSAWVLVAARRLRLAFLTHVAGVTTLALVARWAIPARGVDGAAATMAAVQGAVSLVFLLLAWQVVRQVPGQGSAPHALGR